MEDARRLVSALLAGALPTKILELGARLNLPSPDSPDGRRVPGSVENPRTVEPNERPIVDAWPAVLTVPLAIVKATKTDEVDGDTILTVRYRLRTYLYVRGQGFDDVRDHADRLTLAVTEILLFATELDNVGARTDPTSLSGQFSGVDNLDEVDQVASSYLEFEILLDERLAPTPPPLGPPGPGTADTIIVTTVPPHPALD